MQSGWISDSEYNGYCVGLGLDFPVFDICNTIIDAFIENFNDTTCYQVLAGVFYQ